MLKPGSYDAWKFMDIDFNPTTTVTNPQQPRRTFDMEKIKAVLAKEKTQSKDPKTDGKTNLRPREASSSRLQVKQGKAAAIP